MQLGICAILVSGASRNSRGVCDCVNCSLTVRVCGCVACVGQHGGSVVCAVTPQQEDFDSPLGQGHSV